MICNIPLSKIDEDVVAELVRKLDATNIKIASVNIFLAALKTILKYKRQPCDHFKLRKKIKGRIQLITKVEEETTVVTLLRNTQHSKRREFYYDVADLVECLLTLVCDYLKH